MKKKNKVKNRVIHLDDKFSFDIHCGDSCELLQGSVCPECSEWGGLASSTSTRDREREVTG